MTCAECLNTVPHFVVISVRVLTDLAKVLTMTKGGWQVRGTYVISVQQEQCDFVKQIKSWLAHVRTYFLANLEAPCSGVLVLSGVHTNGGKGKPGLQVLDRDRNITPAIVASALTGDEILKDCRGASPPLMLNEVHTQPTYQHHCVNPHRTDNCDCLRLVLFQYLFWTGNLVMFTQDVQFVGCDG